MDKPPFFPGDHAALREKLHRYLDGLSGRLAAASALAGRVELLLLAGGYGRGEGGVFFAVDGTGDPGLYNDLEFYLLLKNDGDERAARAWCDAEAHRGEEELRIDVEFKILRYDALCRAEPSMFYYDLAAANVRVFGEETALQKLPARLRDAARIPAHEATQLLFNRGTGLLLCEQALRTDSARVWDGFVERNHAKARLAFADAVLALNGRYHLSARERHRRMEEERLERIPENWPQLVAWHAEAVEFKFHPRHENPGRDELARRQDMLVRAWRGVFLWLESARLGTTFADVEPYASYAGRLFPGSPVWKNGLLHARDAARRKLALGGWRDYPRAALQRSLVLLLGGDEKRERLAATWMKLPADTARERIEEKYRSGWQYYN